MNSLCIILAAESSGKLNPSSNKNLSFGGSLSNTTLIINGGGYAYNNKEEVIGTSNLTLMEIGA